MHIDPRLGPWLLDLAERYELRWCTTWRDAHQYCPSADGQRR